MYDIEGLPVAKKPTNEQKTMVVWLLQLWIRVPDAMSLKDKRRAIKSIKERIANRFNVSVAEVGLLDSRREAELGVAMVSNDAKYTQSCLSKVVNLVQSRVKLALLDYTIEML